MLRTNTGHLGATTPEVKQLRENNHLLRQEVDNLRRAFNALHTLHRFTDNASNPDIDVFALVDTILEASLASIGSKDGSLMLVDEDEDELAFVVVHGAARDRLLGHRISLSTGIAGWVARNKESVLVPNVNLDPRFSQTVDRDSGFKTTSLLCTPVVRKGVVLGVIQGLNKANGKSFSEEDKILLSVVAHQAAEAIHAINRLDDE